MSDIKNVLSLLCQYLNCSINVIMKPECFRVAKFNNTAENVNGVFWKTLNALSYYALREKKIELNLQEYDVVSSTKLYFAFLQYPAVEFYALSEQSKNNRPLLLAFAWLLGTQNVLNIVTRVKLSQSVLGKEFSYAKDANKTEITCHVPDTIPGMINNILCLNNKVNYNIKEIFELISEQTKLVSKVHAASANFNGLPHLSVAEVALIKRISTINKNVPSNEDRAYIKELSTISTLLDTYMKWLKKEHIFFEWMVTVVEEHNKSLSKSLEDIDWDEVSKLISLLDSMIQERLKSVSSSEESRNFHCNKTNCVSRLLKTKGDNDTEIDEWFLQISAELEKDTEHSAKIKQEISDKLKQILQSIPHCIQVSF